MIDPPSFVLTPELAIKSVDRDLDKPTFSMTPELVVGIKSVDRYRKRELDTFKKFNLPSFNSKRKTVLCQLHN